jgi:hypothetical protein
MGAPIEWRPEADPIPAHGVQRKLRSVFSRWTLDRVHIGRVRRRRNLRPGVLLQSAQGPSDSEGKWLISKGGGTGPRWRGDGKELFYVASDGKLMSVDIRAKPVFEAGAPRPLFQLPLGFIGVEVTADGRRFLVAVPVAQSASVPFTVVLNWQTALKK